MIKKPKLLRSNPFRFFSIRLAKQKPYNLIDDEDLIVESRNRPRNKNEVKDDDLSDYIKTRLFLARLQALNKFNEKWG